MLIGEVSRQSGVSTRMLRHYDALGLVKPTGRTSGGYREYSADDIRRLFHVESLRTLGLSLNDAKRALDEPDFAPADLVGDLMRHTRARIAAEEELLTKLERVDAASPAEWDDVLRIVALLRAFESESAAHRNKRSCRRTRQRRYLSMLWSRPSCRKTTPMWLVHFSGRWRGLPVRDSRPWPKVSTRRRSAYGGGLLLRSQPSTSQRRRNICNVR